MGKEKWKGIAGFEHYEISSYGRVRSMKRTMMRKNPRWKTAPDHEITVGGSNINGWVKKNKNGSPAAVLVSLRKDGKTHNFKIHKLVLDAFVGPCPSGKEGCHNDGNPLHNNVKNLRWDTRKANAGDSRRHGTYSPPPMKIGENHHFVTISDADVEKIRLIPYRHGLYSSLSKKYKVSLQTISRIYRGASRTGGSQNGQKQIDENAGARRGLPAVSL